MAEKYHIAKDGVARECHATVKRCRYEGTPHFENIEQAQRYAEEKASENFDNKLSLTKKKNALNTEVVGLETKTSILAYRLVAVLDRIEKANKRLEKAGMSERITYELSDKYAIKTENHLYQEYIDILIEQPLIRYAGKKFLAQINMSEGAVTIRTGKDIDLQGWTPKEQVCEHCGIKRKRNTTYLIEDENGNRHQIGSSCVDAYLGGIGVKGLWVFSYDPIETEDREYSNSFNDHTVKKVDTILATALHVTKKRPFISSSEIGSTADIVRTYFDPRARSGANQEDYQSKFGGFELENEKEEVENLKKYINDLPMGDYSGNLKRIIENEYCGEKNFNLLVSAVAGYRKSQNQIQNNKKEWAKGFIGEPNSSIKGRKLNVVKIFETEEYDHYSRREVVKKRVIFADENNHQGIWWTTSHVPFSEGDTLDITGGTVKKQGTYMNNDQTILTRLKGKIIESKKEE